jgi:hypothetical protein
MLCFCVLCSDMGICRSCCFYFTKWGFRLGAGGSLSTNRSYSGGRNQEDRGSKPTRASSSRDPISKNSLQIRAGGVAQGVGCEFKTQYRKEKKGILLGIVFWNLLLFCFFVRVSLCIPAWPPKLRSSWVLGLQACTTLPGSETCFFFFFFYVCSIVGIFV